MNSASLPVSRARRVVARFNVKTLFAAVLFVATSIGTRSFAENPVVQTRFTADPAPVVHDGVLYLYTSHDEDVLVKNFFTMKDWRCYSTTDMVNWTDHGAVASLYDFKWAGSGWGGGFENGAWAPQAIERDGKWYLYVPLQGRGIGVLVADNPFGPFSDPIGKALIKGDNIDPTVFVDDDGQAYLYWGNPKCWYVKLNKDMISFDTSIGNNGLVVLDMTVEEFGKRSKDDPKRLTTYEEGPWLYKRNGLYYLFFAAGPISEHLGYSIGPSAVGPWKYAGVVMDTQSAFTIHPGVVDFKGETYMFYHNAGLPGGGGFHRSVCVDEMEFNPDGTVKKVIPTKTGPAPVATLDPYQRVEAETIAWESGIETEKAAQGGMVVHDIDDGDYIEVKNVDFGSIGASTFAASVASDKNLKSAVELHLDRTDGSVIGTLTVSDTSGQWKTVTTNISEVAGVHSLFLVFKGDSAGDLFKFDWWRFGR